MWLSVVLGVIQGAQAQPPDVVLITLDTCRADRIGAYGYTSAKTPTLDALAAEGLRYSRAYSPVPLTIPSHGALFTGRTPASLQMRRNSDTLAPEAETLAERFQAAGYTTVASVGAFVTSRRWGFDQGFDVYHDSLGARPGSEVVDDLLTWRSHGAAEPVFAWVHLFDAHDSLDAYDAQISVLDEQVSRVVQAFSDRPTLFVVVGDHGESLGEHGEPDHGLFVYESTQRVPYILAGAGVSPGVVDEPVSLMDVAPSLLARLGLPPLDASLGPLVLESYGLQDRFDLAPHRALIEQNYKLIASPRPELYDVVADPSERHDLALAQPERVQRMLARLPPSGEEAPVSTLSAGDRAGLLALGYISPDPVTWEGDSRDAKDHLELIGAVHQADALWGRGEQEGSIALLQRMHTAYPEVREVTLRLAQRLMAVGQGLASLDVLQVALASDPRSSVLRESEAQVLLMLGRRLEGALALERLALELTDRPSTNQRAFDALVRAEGGEERALNLGLGWLERWPDDLQMAGRVGVVLAKRGHTSEAAPWLEKARHAQPPVPNVHFVLAGWADEAGKSTEARRLLEVEVAAHPASVAAVFALAMVLDRTSEWEAQLTIVEGLLERMTEARARAGGPVGADPGAFWALKARALLKLERVEEARNAVRHGLEQDPPHPAIRQLANALL